MEPAHPRVARGTRRGTDHQVRILVYSPAPDRTRFIDNELARGGATIQIARDVKDLVHALVDEPPPRPQVLVIDLDLLPPAEILHLHTLPQQGWFGTIIAVGRVPASLRASLNIATVIGFPLSEDSFREAIGELRFDAKTMRLPVLGP